MPGDADDPLLPLREVRRLSGLGTSTIYRKMGEGTFPRPVRVAERVNRWPLSAITAWRAALPVREAPRAPPAPPDEAPPPPLPPPRRTVGPRPR